MCIVYILYMVYMVYMEPWYDTIGVYAVYVYMYMYISLVDIPRKSLKHRIFNINAISVSEL